MEGGIRELAFGSQGRRHGHGHRALKLAVGLSGGVVGWTYRAESNGSAEDMLGGAGLGFTTDLPEACFEGGRELVCK